MSGPSVNQDALFIGTLMDSTTIPCLISTFSTLFFGGGGGSTVKLVSQRPVVAYTVHSVNQIISTCD